MLAPWKESFDKSRQYILKSRDGTLLTNVHLVKAMVFPVVTYGWELSTKELMLSNGGAGEGS